MAEGNPGTQSQIKEQAPSTWKQKAQEYSWRSRAAAWDADQRLRKLERHQDIVDTIIEATLEALLYLINVMRGRVVEADGAITTIHHPYERRMAAKTLFSKGVDALVLLQDEGDLGSGEVKITEIRVRKSGDDPKKKNNGT